MASRVLLRMGISADESDVAGNWKQSLTARVSAIAAIAAIAGVAPVLAAQSDERQLRAGEASLRTGTTGNDSELLKTIPIGKRLSSKERVVMSLQPGQLGDLADGDRLDATAEVEVSVCLKPNELHGSDRPCIGRTYGYDPVVNAKPGARQRTGRDQRRQARQQQAHVHAVTAEPKPPLRARDRRRRGRHRRCGQLPCNEDTCHVNLVLSAAHPSAKGARQARGRRRRGRQDDQRRQGQDQHRSLSLGRRQARRSDGDVGERAPARSRSSARAPRSRNARSTRSSSADCRSASSW